MKYVACCVIVCLFAFDAAAQSESPITEGLTGTADAAKELLENLPEEIPAGFDMQVRFEPMSMTERSIYGSTGAAEISAALLLRGNKQANQALAKATQELGAKPVTPVVGTPASAANTNKLLRRLGAPGRAVSLLANLSALRGLASPQRLRALGGNLGTFGRFSTRQVLYAHGTYSTVSSVTGYKARVNIDVSEEMVPIAPLEGPTKIPVVPAAPVVSTAPDDDDVPAAPVPVAVEEIDEPKLPERVIDPDDPPEPRKDDGDWILDDDPLGIAEDIVNTVCPPDDPNCNP